MYDNCGEWVISMGVVSRRREWVESMGVVSRRWVWVKSMGVDSGCGCKEVDFLILLYLLLLYLSFWQQHPYFLLIFTFLFQYFLVIYVIICSCSINTHTTTGVPRLPYEGLHILFYIYAKCPHKRFILCDGYQLYAG